MASIYKRGGKGTYYITYVVRPGVRKTEKGCHDRAATEAYARKLEAEAFLRRKGIIDVKTDQHTEAEGRPLVVRNKDKNVVGGHAADFYDDLIAKGDTEKHAMSRRNQVCRLVELCKAKRISQLTPSKVQAALKALRGEGLSLQSCNHYLRSIKQFSRWLWRDGRAPEHTLAHLAGFNVKLDRRHDRRALQDEELCRLIDAAEKGPVVCGLSGRERAMLYRIAAGTGFRRNEIRSLTPESFDLDANPPTITVEASYSKRRRRDVQPIRKDLAELLRLWLVWKRRGEPVIQTSVWLWHKTSKMMKADLETAKIDYKDASGKYADFHSLRHTYITNIGRLPVSMKTHQELARHCEPSLTMRYTHTQIDDKALALKALPSVDSSRNCAQATEFVA